MALEQREKKMVVALGLLLAVAVIFGGAQMLRHRGSSSGDTDTTVLGAPGTPLPSPSPSGHHKQARVPTFQGLDPFQTEVVLPPPSPSPSPTQTLEPSPSPSSNPSAPSSAVVGGHTVSLLDVFQQAGTDQAVVMVDGTVYTVKKGDSFAQEYSVEAIQDPCATFSWQSQQTFDLCSSSGP